MRKLAARVLLCALIAGLLWTWTLFRERQTLRDKLIRFHVVANSDSAEDQKTKLLVRDAVMKDLRQEMSGITDIASAEAYLSENLPRIQQIANETLQHLGVDAEAVVSLCREAFDTRVYDTFTLPAGVYNALRITIGEGAGKNWWCVVFPGFCMGAVSTGFAEQAVSSGFSEKLAETLAEPDSCNIRFFFLDKLGQLENIFFSE